ncbi:MAG: hypothetical protein QXP53_00330 [Candidatus Pacearchaeota archaeon]
MANNQLYTNLKKYLKEYEFFAEKKDPNDPATRLLLGKKLTPNNPNHYMPASETEVRQVLDIGQGLAQQNIARTAKGGLEKIINTLDGDTLLSLTFNLLPAKEGVGNKEVTELHKKYQALRTAMLAQNLDLMLQLYSDNVGVPKDYEQIKDTIVYWLSLDEKRLQVSCGALLEHYFAKAKEKFSEDVKQDKETKKVLKKEKVVEYMKNVYTRTDEEKQVPYLVGLAETYVKATEKSASQSSRT